MHMLGTPSGGQVTSSLLPQPAALVLSGASMTRKRQENVKNSVKNRKFLPISPQCCHGKPMKWEGLTGISFRMCISRVECKAAKKDLKLLKKPCALLSHGTAAISQVI